MYKKRIISRREFIKITGLATGGLAIPLGAQQQILALSEVALKKIAQGTGKVSWRKTVCRLCPGGCSLEIKRVDGVPILLKGSNFSPINRGGLCPAAHANLEILYHPDRFTEPAARELGPLRKDLEPVSWEAIENSTSKLINDLVKQNQGHKIAIINGDDTPIMREAWQKFANAVGTPNIYHSDYSGLSDNSTMMLQGYKATPTYDFINSGCIISLGANFLEEDGAPVHHSKVFGEFKDQKNLTRKKMIYVGPRANITASSANRWIPLKPDTWGTLALGILHILITESRLNLDFIRKTSNGFFDWSDQQGETVLGIESQIRTEFHPKNVEAITGVPMEDIHYLAGLIQMHSKCAIVLGSEALRSPRGNFHQWAVHCLNYCVGNIQAEGGHYFRNEDAQAEFSPVHMEAEPIQNLFYADKANPIEKPSLDIFAKRVEGYAPYEIELLIINKANPVYEGENRSKWEATLKHIPRVVFLGDLPNETSAFADVILATHSALETWDLVQAIPTVPFDSASLQRPVIEPMYNTKSSYSILKAFVDGADQIQQSLLSERDSKKLVQNKLINIHKQNRGTLFEAYSDGEWAEIYKEHRRLKPNQIRKTFMKGLLKSGGWWDPASPAAFKLPDVVKTDSKKIELMSPNLFRYDYSRATRSQLLKASLGTVAYPAALMQYNKSGKADFPLTLISGFTNTNPAGNTVYSPSMLESFGILREIYWEPWAEIHPTTAHTFGIEDGEFVQIDSQVGQINVRARVRPVILPGTVFVPMGLGRDNVGRFGSDIGEDPRELMVAQPEISTGNTILSGTPIRISRG